MIKRFFTNPVSVALILTTIILVGFSSINIAKAQTSANTPAVVQTPTNPTYTDGSTNIRYYYEGNGLWHKMPISTVTDGLYISTSDMEAYYSMPQAVVNEAAQYDTDLAEWQSQNDITTTSIGNEVLTLIGNLSDKAAGLIALPLVGGWILFFAILNIVFSALVTISGLVFDLAIQFSIFNIKDFFSNNGVVDILWKMIRDMINISFIFILLYIAITKIIGSLNVKSKTTIINVIISAIFINFSMFITKILIDVGNMVAVEFFNLISPAGIGVSISEMIFKGTTLYDTVNAATSLTGQTTMIISLVLQFICTAILVWVFFYFAIIIIGRTAALVFLTMTSPVGFIGETIPFLGDFSKKWWATLIDQILVAPFIMFFLYFITQIIKTGTIITSLGNASTKSGWSYLDSPGVNVSGFFLYLLIIVLLWQGLKMAKSLSGEVGKITVKVVGTAAVAAGAAVTAGATLGVGAASGAAGAAAQLAGKKGISAIGARLAFSAKNLGESKVGKFVTGKYDKTGAVGMATTFAREKVMSGIKEATGGMVDAKKLEKRIEKAKKEAETNVAKKAEAVGPQKYFDRQKQLKDIKANIKVAAIRNIKIQEEKIIEDKKKGKSEEEIKNIDKQEEAKKKENIIKDKIEKEKVLKEKEKVVKTSEENLAKAKGTPAEEVAQKAHTEATEARNSAQIDFNTADTKVRDFEKDEKKKIDEEMKKVAEEMGTSMDEIAKEEKSLIGKITEGVEKRNEYIKSISNRGMVAGWWKTSLLFGDDRKKLIEKIKAQKGKFTTDEDKMIKRFKDFAKKEEEKETGEAAPESEPKSKEEKTESEPKAE